MNGQADSLIESGQFEAGSIQERRSSINERYERIRNLAAHRQARLNEANTLHQFFRDIADEESWIKLVLYFYLLWLRISIYFFISLLSGRKNSWLDLMIMAVI